MWVFCVVYYSICIVVTHWPLDKMLKMTQMTFSNAAYQSIIVFISIEKSPNFAAVGPVEKTNSYHIMMIQFI